MPSVLTSLATRNIKFNKAADSFAKNGSMWFSTYPSRSNGLMANIQLTQTGGFQLADGVPTNATIAQASNNQPQDVSLSHYLYTPGDKAPLVYRPHPYLRITDNGTGGGLVTFSNVNFAKMFKDATYLYTVFNNQKAAYAAGDLTIVLRSSVGNFTTITLNKTTSAAAEWAYETIPFQDATNSRVTVTGTMDWTVTDGEIDLIATQANDVINVFDIYTSKEEWVPANTIHINLADDCLEEIAAELGVETYDSLCGLNRKSIEATGVLPTWSITLKEPTLLLEAMAYGAYPEIIEIEDELVGTYNVVAGTISTGQAIGAGQTRRDVRRVKINNTNLIPSTDPDLVGDTKFYVDKASGDITVSTEYNGTQNADVTFTTVRTTDGFVKKDNTIGLIGFLNLKMTSNGNTEIKRLHAQLTPDSINTPSDNDLSKVYKLSLIDTAEKFRQGLY